MSPPTTPPATPTAADDHDSVDAPDATPQGFLHPLREFLAAETAGAALLVVGALAALIWVNSPWKASYERIWHTLAGVSIGTFHIELDLHAWVNDGFMALFFLVVGLEIKRELVEGELASVRKAALPAVAALGGMIVPAAIYIAITAGTPDVGAWGIPMATDIALAMGLLTVLGKRLPTAAKVFLLALAIVDDLGAIAVIAIAYSSGMQGRYLLGAAACIGAVLALRRFRPAFTVGFVVLGVALWWCVHEAGIHATIAGVVMGFLTPTAPRNAPDEIDMDKVSDISTLSAAHETIDLARSSISRVEWLEHALHPWTSLLIVPVFAFANAGITINRATVTDMSGSRVVWGIILGLVVGKPLGITLGVWIGRRFGLTLPEGTGMGDIAALGLIAGIGFTVSIFVADLAIKDVSVSNAARLAILVASVLAAGLGAAAVLLRSKQSDSERDEVSSQRPPQSAPR